VQTLFVDPPRSGLDDESVQLIAEFDQVVYISCNPDTLHKNLEVGLPYTGSQGAACACACACQPTPPYPPPSSSAS
jgi:hypothetical protein